MDAACHGTTVGPDASPGSLARIHSGVVLAKAATSCRADAYELTTVSVRPDIEGEVAAMEQDSGTQLDPAGSMEKKADERLRTPAWLGVAGVLVALLLVGLTGGGMMMGPGMMLGGPLLLVGLGVLVVWLLRGGQVTDVLSRWDRPREDSAQDILDARYARGELTDEQYDSMRRKLG